MIVGTGQRIIRIGWRSFICKPHKKFNVLTDLVRNHLIGFFCIELLMCICSQETEKYFLVFLLYL